MGLRKKDGKHRFLHESLLPLKLAKAYLTDFEKEFDNKNSSSAKKKKTPTTTALYVQDNKFANICLPTGHLT